MCAAEPFQKETEMRNRTTFYLVLFVFAATICSARKQTPAVQTGSVAGVIQDAQGAAVEGAQVLAFQANSEPAGKAGSDKTGAYTLTLAPGKYTVRVTAEGYKTSVVENVAVGTGDTLKINLNLTPGTSAETEAVDWQSPAGFAALKAETQSTTPSVKELPLSTRNYTQATGLATGASSQVANATAIGMNTQGVQVGSGSTNSYLMDGAPISASAGELNRPGFPTRMPLPPTAWSRGATRPVPSATPGPTSA